MAAIPLAVAPLDLIDILPGGQLTFVAELLDLPEQPVQAVHRRKLLLVEGFDLLVLVEDRVDGLFAFGADEDLILDAEGDARVPGVAKHCMEAAGFLVELLEKRRVAALVEESRESVLRQHGSPPPIG